MDLVIEYLQRRIVVGSESFTGTIDDAAKAAATGLARYQAGQASIKDAETREELKAVVQT